MRKTLSRIRHLMLRGAVAQVSKPAVSPTSKSADGSNDHPVADSEIRDTADLEVCATPLCAKESLQTSGAVEKAEAQSSEKISPRPPLYGLVRDKK